MRHLLTAIFALLVCFSAAAQKEQDFASTYISQYGKGTSLNCVTVSPAMIGKVLQNATADNDTDTQQALKKVKSMRVVTAKKAAEATALYEKALELIKANSARYKLYKDYDNKSLYVRRRGKTYVELILLACGDKGLQIVNITGKWGRGLSEV